MIPSWSKWRLGRNNGGNAILQMLLFTPLVLMTLFAAVDIGLYFIDKSKLIEAVNLGLDSVSGIRKSVKATSVGFSSDGNTTYNPEFVRAAKDTILREVLGNLASSIYSSETLPADKAHIVVAPVYLTFDRQTGELVDVILDGEVSYGSLADGEEISRNTIQTKVEEHVRSANGSLSPFAVVNSSANALSFMDKTLVFFAVGKIKPNSIGGMITESILGESVTINYSAAKAPREVFQ